jgi:hypothetical protein
MQPFTEEKTTDHVKKSDLVHSVVGSGPFRKIVLATPLENDNKNRLVKFVVSLSHPESALGGAVGVRLFNLVPRVLILALENQDSGNEVVDYMELTYVS